MGLKRFFRRGWEISGSESELIHEAMYLYQFCFPYINQESEDRGGKSVWSQFLEVEGPSNEDLAKAKGSL